MADFSLMNIARKAPLKKRGALDLYGTGEIDPDFEGQTSGKVAAKPGGSWKGALGAGLMGAAGAIQANVGPAKPGAALAQGLLKGIVGTGLVKSALDQQEAEAARRDAVFQEKKDLAEMAARAKPTAAEKIAFEVDKQKALQPGLEKLARISSGIKTDAQLLIERGQKGMSEAEIARTNADLAKQTKDHFEEIAKGKFPKPPPPTQQEIDDYYYDLQTKTYGGKPKPIKRPILAD